MEIGKKEQLIIGVGMLLFVKIFDWPNYFLLLGFVFIILGLSNDKEEQSEESDSNNSN